MQQALRHLMTSILTKCCRYCVYGMHTVLPKLHRFLTTASEASGALQGVPRKSNRRENARKG